MKARFGSTFEKHIYIYIYIYIYERIRFNARFWGETETEYSNSKYVMV